LVIATELDTIWDLIGELDAKLRAFCDVHGWHFPEHQKETHMTAAAAVQHRTQGWLVGYKGRGVRLMTGPNAHNLCHVFSPGSGAEPTFAGYAMLHELHSVYDELDMPIEAISV